MGLSLPALGGELLPEHTAHDAAVLLTIRHFGIAVALVLIAPIAAHELTKSLDTVKVQGVALDPRRPAATAGQAQTRTQAARRGRRAAAAKLAQAGGRQGAQHRSRRGPRRLRPDDVARRRHPDRGGRTRVPARGPDRRRAGDPRGAVPRRARLHWTAGLAAAAAAAVIAPAAYAFAHHQLAPPVPRSSTRVSRGPNRTPAASRASSRTRRCTRSTSSRARTARRARSWCWRSRTPTDAKAYKKKYGINPRSTSGLIEQGLSSWASAEFAPRLRSACNKSRTAPVARRHRAYGGAPMSADPRHHLGRRGEELAAQHFERLGYEIVARNHRTRWGELDLVAFDGHTLVFCEVKTRRRAGGPWESLHASKREQVRRMGAAYLAEVSRPPAGQGAALRRGRRRDRRRRPARRARSPRGGVLERELLVGRALERQPVQRRDAVLGDRVAVLGRRVADVATRSPSPGGATSARCMKRSRVTLARIDAAAIAADFASPSITARCSKPKSATGKPSVRHSVPGTATRISDSRSAARLVLCSPRLSIPITQRETIALLVAARRTIGYRRSRASGSVLLGVVEGGQRATLGQRQRLEVEQDRGGDQRTGQATAPRLVGTGDEAHAQLAVVGEQPPAAAAALGRLARLARPGAAARGTRSGWGASR